MFSIPSTAWPTSHTQCTTDKRQGNSWGQEIWARINIVHVGLKVSHFRLQLVWQFILQQKHRIFSKHCSRSKSMYVDVCINACISMWLYLWDSSDPLYTSCRLPYLSDPVVLLRYQLGKVTRVAQWCPPHSNNPGGIETENWASGKCPPSSKILETITLISAVKSHFTAFYFTSDLIVHFIVI